MRARHNALLDISVRPRTQAHAALCSDTRSHKSHNVSGMPKAARVETSYTRVNYVESPHDPAEYTRPFLPIGYFPTSAYLPSPKGSFNDIETSTRVLCDLDGSTDSIVAAVTNAWYLHRP